MSSKAVPHSSVENPAGEATGRDRDAQALIERHVEYLWRELRGEVSLSEASAREMRDYYPWVTPSSESRAAIVKGTMVARLKYTVEWLMARGGATRVLDAGCGLGTESLLFAQLGAEVVGVDLYEKYIKAARERLPRFEEHLGKALPVSFAAMNLFDVPAEEPFDFIYCREAISHIDPVGDFMDFSYSHLAPGGQLVVSDANGACLANHLDRLLARGTHCHRQQVDPATGRCVPIANERILSIPGLKRELRRAGLRPVHEERRMHVQRLGRLGASLPVRAVARVLERAPLLSLLACTHYVIGAERPVGTHGGEHAVRGGAEPS